MSVSGCAAMQDHVLAEGWVKARQCKQEIVQLSDEITYQLWVSKGQGKYQPMVTPLSGKITYPLKEGNGRDIVSNAR
jgi:hypothetical protein